MKRQIRMERMKAIDREYRIAVRAADLLDGKLRADPSFLDEELQAVDARGFRENLESTYLLRLFAEFEQGLREWRGGTSKKSGRLPARELIEYAKGKRAIAEDLNDAVHAVRRFRNSIIHEGGGPRAPVPFRVARKCLSLFFSRLPPTW